MLAALTPRAHASTSFTNGAFTESCTGGSGAATQTTCTDGGGQLGFNTDATGWTNGQVGTSYGSPATTYGYNFLFTSSSQATTGTNGTDGSIALYNGTGGTFTLTGAQNGDGITGGAVPGGGNIIADDGAYNAAAISQTITGLTPGAEYAVGFYWAGAQQTGFTGANTEQWQVTLGSQTLSTAVVDNNSEGFTGWMQQTLTFTATSASEALSFLAVGTPVSPSEPPFALLTDVTFAQTPEPGTLGLMLTGFGLIGAGVLRSRRRAKRQ